MDEIVSEEEMLPPPRARWRRWYIHTGVAIVLLLLLAILLPGPLLRYGLKTELENIGFRNVVVQRSDASIFDLLFGVGGVDVEAPDGSHANLRNVKTDLDWASLFEKHIQFELVELSGLSLQQQALELDIHTVLPNLLAGDNLKMTGKFNAKGRATKRVHKAADIAGPTLERIDLSL